MAGSQFQRYLNEKRASSRSSFMEEKRKNDIKAVLGIAATVGAGIGAHRLYKAGAFDNALRKGGDLLNSAVRSGREPARNAAVFTRALGNTIKERGFIKTLAGQADDLLERQLRSGYTSALKNAGKPLDGIATDITQLIEKRGRMKAELMKSYIGNERFKRITEDFGYVIGKDSELFKDISGVLGRDDNRKGLLDKSRSGHLFQLFKDRGLGDKYADDQLQGASDLLEQVLQRYRGKTTEWARPLTRSELRDQAKVFSGIVDQQFNELLTPKDTARARFLEKMGIRNATVEDALKHPEWFDGNSQKFAVKTKRGRAVDGKFVPVDEYRKLQNLVQGDEKAKNLILGKSIMVDGQGDLVDYRYVSRAGWSAFTGFADGFQIPFVNINPLRLAHAITIEGVHDAEKMAILRKGSRQLALGSTDPLQEDMLYAGGKIFNLKGEQVRDNVYLASSRYGLFKRIFENMGELGEQKTGNWIQNAFDIGLQGRESDLKRGASFFTKFSDPRWDPNLVYGMSREYIERGAVSEELAEATYKNIYDTLNRHARPVGTDVMDRLTPELARIFPDLTQEDLMMNTNEQVIQTLGKLIKAEMSQETSIRYGRKTGIISQLIGNAKLYSSNEDMFNMIKQAVSDPEVALPELLSSLQPSGTRMVDKYMDTKRLIQQEMIAQLEVNRVNTRGLLDGLTDKQIRSFDELEALTSMRRLWSSVQGQVGDTVEEAAQNKREALSHFAASMISPTDKQKRITQSIEEAVSRYNPWYGYGPGDRPTSEFGSPYIVMNKAVNPIKAVNETIKAGGNFSDIMKTISESTVGQLGFDFGFGFGAGRKNLDKVTTATAASYYYFDRLNDGISRAGLGLSQKSLGSAQDVAKNLLLRRYGATLLGLSVAGYAAYEFQNLTGVDPKDAAGSTYVNMTKDVARLKDLTGITELNKMLGRMLPGSDRLFQNPLGAAVKYGSFGLIGDDRDSEELENYWSRGSDPVRRGRWWGIGSNTPWYGGKIDHYAPNWYRRMKSDYKFTDVLYGSEDEYWANHWMPTPRYPFAPLNHFILDPNHWTRKHRDDRPYPVSGGIGTLRDIPLVGPVLDGTIGQVLNPQVKRPGLERAHRQYLEEINESIKDKYYNESSGQYYMTPSGRGSIVSVGASGFAEGLDGTGFGMPVDAGDGGVYSIGGDMGGYVGASGTGKALTNIDLTQANMNIVSRSAVGPAINASLDSFRDPDFVESLDEVVDPGSIGYRFGETLYSATEIGGIYGFAVTSFTGEFGSTRPVLESSNYMTSPTRAFWDQNLGGFGGNVSEIGRRFIPRKRREEQYNPFRNTMPDWMPGVEYFTDFKHGDPYVKIAGGEYRLPGSGYESLNKLHPDQFGEYGAIDRFKILADVAPYSEQYRYYKKVLSVYNQSDMLSDQEKQDIAAIKKQVQESKKKYDFTPYKFKYADIDTRNVTIDYMIDETTFMTKEFPDHPLRMAGIKMPSQSDQSPEAEAARAYLAEHLSPGKRVKVGIDSDDLFRVRDDTLQTMRAVVYDSGGTSVNARLARSQWGHVFGFGGRKVVEGKWDDSSATTVNALYHPAEITIGKVWESIAHMDTPLHTKFLQIRSPLEMYKRRELYGKNWQSWENPIRDWIKPTFESYSKANPVVATGLGALLGSLFIPKGRSKATGATIGAIIAGAGSTLRVATETARRVTGDTDYTWIPQRRVKERQIDEYFDMLEYVKYRGLYEKTRKMAIRREGVDVEKFIGASKDFGGSVKGKRKAIEREKRWIKINMAHPAIDKDEAKAELAKLNDELGGLDDNRLLSRLGPISLQAIKYRTAYESTLYGADPGGDVTKIYRALPKKDREFFKEFMTASPDEREEILRLVPENQRRFYQSKWGLKMDPKKNLEQYFMTHYLPDPTWEGWRPDVSLEAVKLKVARNEALDISEFGFFPGDERKAIGAPNVKPFMPSGFLSIGRIRNVLRGSGITNADIKLAIGPGNKEHSFDVNVNVEQDRRGDIIGIMNSDLRNMITV